MPPAGLTLGQCIYNCIGIKSHPWPAVTCGGKLGGDLGLLIREIHAVFVLCHACLPRRLGISLAKLFCSPWRCRSVLWGKLLLAMPLCNATMTSRRISFQHNFVLAPGFPVFPILSERFPSHSKRVLFISSIQCMLLLRNKYKRLIGGWFYAFWQ